MMGEGDDIANGEEMMMALIGLSIVVAVAIAELVLSMQWKAGYFTNGIPIFNSRIETSQPLARLSLDDLANSTKTAAGAPLSIHPIGPDVIAFREGSIQYLPLMRGVIRRKTEEPAVVVQGLINWYIVTLLIVLIVMLRGNIKDVLIYLGAGLAVLYLIQGIRFWRLASHVRKQLM
jgi:hypothetical protein